MTSSPLPLVEIHRPSAERGADDVREHLDGLRCIFCNVPVGDDEQRILADHFGTLRVFPICKEHHEHPDSWNLAVHGGKFADKMYFCPTCGDLTTYRSITDECWVCNFSKQEVL